ncbi:MAG: dihydroneopterin aldolase [Acidimicrobiia bacterium]|nr:dihydroneopterin aldolase [Acidimicrobiia bacterium]
MDLILVSGIRCMGVHGVLPEEKARPQPFEVDVELEVDVSTAGQTDALDDTVDYAAVCDGVRAVVESEHYDLLERLATRLTDVCRTDARVGAATVTVRKMHPPVASLVDHVAVRIRR